MIRLLFYISGIIFFTNCKSHKTTTNSNSTGPTKTESVTTQTVSNIPADGLIIGKVTYLVNGNSCLSIVIQDDNKDMEAKLILFPKDALPADLAIEGQLITFNYRVLKIKNPEGCLKGMPAALSDVKKK